MNNPSLESRVSKLEAFYETQQRDINRLITTLEVTNRQLAKAINALTAIRTTQRNAHAFSAILGTFVGGFLDIAFKKLSGS